MFIKTTPQQFEKWINFSEDKQLEFKKAKNSFSEDKDLPDYCAAISNEGGGKLILGVDNNRNVVGTSVYTGNENKISGQIFQKIKIKIFLEIFNFKSKRILIVHIPPRLIGQPVKSTGHYRYPMRTGESLAEMDSLTLKNILNENEPDFSNETISNLTLDDLSEEAINNLKILRAKKSGNVTYTSFSNKKILDSLGLISSKGINYAGLILVGKEEYLRKYLPDAEIIFEWRQDPIKTAYDYRENWRKPFVLIFDNVWNAINARNLRIPFQEGFIQRVIPAFAEKSIREAILNAVAHRDYRIKGRSIFINANPDGFTIESPGGFIAGITPENILTQKAWRNRALAEALEKIGLVERSGQGINEIFESTIRDGKGLPDFSKSDRDTVNLFIPAKVKDEKFILFLEKITTEKAMQLSSEEIFELESIREQKLTTNLEFKNKFLEAGIIEKTGIGRGTKYILSYKYYQSQGIGVTHTRLVGLEREKIKELIYEHLKKHKKAYYKDFCRAFSELKPKDITNLLQELSYIGKVDFDKDTRYWVCKVT